MAHTVKQRHWLHLDLEDGTSGYLIFSKMPSLLVFPSRAPKNDWGMKVSEKVKFALSLSLILSSPSLSSAFSSIFFLKKVRSYSFPTYWWRCSRTGAKNPPEQGDRQQTQARQTLVKIIGTYFLKEVTYGINKQMCILNVGELFQCIIYYLKGKINFI